PCARGPARPRRRGHDPRRAAGGRRRRRDRRTAAALLPQARAARGAAVRWLAGAVVAMVLGAAGGAQSIALGVTLPPGGIAFGEAFELHIDRTASMGVGEPDPVDERALAPLVIEPVGQEVVAGGSGLSWNQMTVRLRF